MLLNIDGEREWKPCFMVKDIDLPTGYYFGASAATGDLAGWWVGVTSLGGETGGVMWSVVATMG